MNSKERQPQEHVQTQCYQNESHSNLFKIDVTRTSATEPFAKSMDVTSKITRTTCSKSMTPDPYPQKHLPSRCYQKLSHSYMFLVDVPSNLATAKCSKPMSPRPQPQQHCPSRRAQNIKHDNLFRVDVPWIWATTTLSESTFCSLFFCFLFRRVICISLFNSILRPLV